ncbi:unnamed protein product [Callosobruchus maculatus]|uniref:Serine protease K12H4.7 n=1 Tax=Callosobruchus maculatus TaxID=64391 RepID=A0A653BYF7_CALMS|nr:unnamed protein product [Callosobruchus maculatus]
MRGFLSLITCFAILQNVRGWREFSRGRSKGGNLGLPGGDDLVRGEHEKVTTEWFTQYLDHSSPTDSRTWKQRYFVNDQYVNQRRDVAFLMIGGEGEASIQWMTKGAWINYAKKFNAICFQLEHRYYGKSHPTADLSTENLQYLTSEQALADIAYFIEEMNVKYELSPNVKWIAFGGSYPGSLAAWVRQRYPHLVYGSMAASGPLLAEINFSEYFTVVYNDLKGTGGDKCVSAVKQAFYQVDLLTRHMVGQRNLDKLFVLCDSIAGTTSSSEDIANLFETLNGHFAETAQYNKDNRMSKVPNNITLDTLCNIMVNDKLGPEVNRLAAVNDLMMKRNNQTCLDYKYDKMISDMRNVSWGSEVSEGGRQWYYQTCTDFGFYQTTDRIPLDFFIKQCSDIFGPKFNLTIVERGVQRTNTLYGGLNPSVTNVIFVQGSYDPWHALGINKSTKLYPAVVIDSASHCENMYSPSVYDSEALRQARIQIEEFIGNLLKSA